MNLLHGVLNPSKKMECYKAKC